MAVPSQVVVDCELPANIEGFGSGIKPFLKQKDRRSKVPITCLDINEILFAPNAIATPVVGWAHSRCP